MSWQPITKLPSASDSGKKFLIAASTPEPNGIKFVEIATFIVSKNYVGFDQRMKWRQTTHWMEIPEHPTKT